MTITFEYHHKIKPFVRMTQRGKYIKLEAQEYLVSKEALSLAMANHLQLENLTPIPRGVPFEVVIDYVSPRAFIFDLDNLIKAVLDSANKVFWYDDRWCVHVQGSKAYHPDYHLYMEVLERVLK